MQRFVLSDVTRISRTLWRCAGFFTTYFFTIKAVSKVIAGGSTPLPKFMLANGSNPSSPCYARADDYLKQI